MWAFGETVDYSLESTVTPPTALSCSPSKTTIPYGGTLSLSGKLSESQIPLGGQYLFVQGYAGGYKTLGMVQTAAGYSWPVAGAGAPYDLGTYKLTAKRMANTRFRAVYGGMFFKHSPSSSAYRDVYVNAYLSTPSAPSTAYRGRTFTAWGYLKPRHTAGTYPVQLRFERYEAGKWVLRKTVKAKASNYLGYSKYKASVVLPYSGSWRVRAYHAADSITALNGNAATYSGYRAITAR